MIKSVYSEELKRFISLETIDQKNIEFVKNGIITSVQSQWLLISDHLYDGE